MSEVGEGQYIDVDPMAWYFGGEVKFVCSKLFDEDLDAVYLFGSYSKGKASLDSDIDVMVVLRDRLLRSQRDDVFHEIEDNLRDSDVAVDNLHLMVVGKDEFDNPEKAELNGEKIASAKREGILEV